MTCDSELRDDDDWARLAPIPQRVSSSLLKGLALSGSHLVLSLTLQQGDLNPSTTAYCKISPFWPDLA